MTCNEINQRTPQPEMASREASSQARPHALPPCVAADLVLREAERRIQEVAGKPFPTERLPREIRAQALCIAAVCINRAHEALLCDVGTPLLSATSREKRELASRVSDVLRATRANVPPFAPEHECDESEYLVLAHVLPFAEWALLYLAKLERHPTGDGFWLHPRKTGSPPRYEAGAQRALTT